MVEAFRVLKTSSSLIFPTFVCCLTRTSRSFAISKQTFSVWNLTLLKALVVILPQHFWYSLGLEPTKKAVNWPLHCYRWGDFKTSQSFLSSIQTGQRTYCAKMSPSLLGYLHLSSHRWVLPHLTSFQQKLPYPQSGYRLARKLVRAIQQIQHHQEQFHHPRWRKLPQTHHHSIQQVNLHSCSLKLQRVAIPRTFQALELQSSLIHFKLIGNMLSHFINWRLFKVLVFRELLIKLFNLCCEFVKNLIQTRVWFRLALCVRLH